MLRLLIADDEKIIRETISTLIDWESHGFELVAVCKDGIETYNAILDEYPDVVLTDIKMPGLSGLELIREIRGIDADTEFIILSGYGEFEFAKQAMECGVRHYLLKPTSEEKILEVLEQVKAECNRKKVMRSLSRKYRTSIKDQFIIESFVLHTALDTLLERYEGMFEQPEPCFALYFASYLPEADLLEFDSRLRRLTDSFGMYPYFHLLYVKSSAAFVLNVPEGWQSSDFDSGLAQIYCAHQTVELYYAKQVYSDLGSLFSDMVKNLRRYDRILLLDDEGRYRELSNFAAPLEEADAFLEKLEAIDGDYESTVKELDQLFACFHRLDNARALAAKLLVKLAASPHGLEGGLAGCMDELYACEDVQQITYLMKREISHQMEDTGGKRRDFVARTISFVREHLQDPDLSLKWIAENLLYMNVNYLSKQFLKETGEKFSSFLTRLRIDRAKELFISGGEERIYEVAEQVGFGENPRYFSQLFKKCTGLTPTAYIAQKGRDMI